MLRLLLSNWLERLLLHAICYQFFKTSCILLQRFTFVPLTLLQLQGFLPGPTLKMCSSTFEFRVCSSKIILFMTGRWSVRECNSGGGLIYFLFKNISI